MSKCIRIDVEMSEKMSENYQHIVIAIIIQITGYTCQLIGKKMRIQAIYLYATCRINKKFSAGFGSRFCQSVRYLEIST